MENQATESTEVTEKKTNERYEVEWCSEPYFDEVGDIVPDRCTYKFKYFAELKHSIRFAGIICKDCYFGCAQIRKQYFSKKIKKWLLASDFEMIEIS